MPPPRPDPTPSRGGDGHAPQSAASEAAPAVAAGGGSHSWVPLVVTVVVLPLVAYGITTFVLVPQMQKSLVTAGLAPAKAAAPAAAHGGGEGAGGLEVAPVAGQKQTVTIQKLLVNVAGTMASRYLLTSMTLISDAPDFAARVQQNEPKLRDMATGLMMMKTIPALEKPGARNLLRGELIAGFNTILGNSAVQELYFTEFAIQ